MKISDHIPDPYGGNSNVFPTPTLVTIAAPLLVTEDVVFNSNLRVDENTDL